jgi:hypothetical protein
MKTATRNRNRDVDVHCWDAPHTFGEGKVMFFTSSEAAAAWMAMGQNDHERIVRLIAALEDADVNVLEVAGAVATHSSRVKRWLNDLDADVEYLPSVAKVTVAKVSFYFEAEFAPLFWDSFCTFLALMMGTAESEVIMEAQVLIGEMHVDQDAFFHCWNLVTTYHPNKNSVVRLIGQGRTLHFDQFFSLNKDTSEQWVLESEVDDEVPGLEKKQYGPVRGSLFAQIAYIQARVGESLSWDGETAPKLLHPTCKSGPAVFVKERSEEYGALPLAGTVICVDKSIEQSALVTLVIECGSTLNVWHVTTGEILARLSLCLKADRLCSVSVYGYDSWCKVQMMYPTVEFALCGRLDLHPIYSDTSREVLWGRSVPCVFYYGSENRQPDKSIIASRAWSPPFLERLWNNLGPVSVKWTDHVYRQLSDKQVSSMIRATIAYSEGALFKHINVWAFDTENIPNDGTDRVTDWHAIEITSGRFVRGDSHATLLSFLRDEVCRSLFLVKGADREAGLFRRMGFVPEPRAQGKLWLGILDIAPLCKSWTKEGKNHRARDGAEQVLYRVAQALFDLDERLIVRGEMDDILRESVESLQSVSSKNGILVFQTPMYRTCNDFFPQAIGGPDCWNNAGTPMPLYTRLVPDVVAIAKGVVCRCDEKRADARAGKGPAAWVAWHTPHYDSAVRPTRMVVRYLPLKNKFGPYCKLAKAKYANPYRLWSGESFNSSDTPGGVLGGSEVSGDPVLKGF